jgi:hypothetical protein
MEVIKNSTTCQILRAYEDPGVQLEYLLAESTREKIRSLFAFANASVEKDEDEKSLFFDHGFYAEGAATIERLSFSKNKAYVRLLGPTTIGKKLFGLLNKEVFAKVNADLDVFIHEQFGSKCRVSAAFEFANLFSTEFRSFLTTCLQKEYSTNPATSVTIHPFEIDVKINALPKEIRSVADLKMTRRDNLVIRVPDFEAFEKHIYEVFSELDFEAHLRVVQGLESAVKLTRV